MKQVWKLIIIFLHSKISKFVFQIISLVSKKTGIADLSSQNLQSYQQGGTFIKLENEWRETIKQRNLNAKTIKPK